MRTMINKMGQAVRGVAREVCSVAPGSRIPTVSELEERCGASRGNVQKALSFLKESGAVALEAHGQSGTILTSIDYLALAGACGVTSITGSMPLPYTSRYEGLATALFTLLGSRDLRSYITFQRGSGPRVQMLLEGMTDYCVMSRLAYEDIVRRGAPIVEALALGPLSYVGRHVLISRDSGRTDWKGARVGIDESSVDQCTLTRNYFSQTEVEYVPVQYIHIVEEIESGELDAGIWNEDDVHLRASGLTFRPIGTAGEADEKNTRASLVVRKDDALTRHLLSSLIDPESVLDVQSKVMSGQLPARY